MYCLIINTEAVLSGRNVPLRLANHQKQHWPSCYDVNKGLFGCLITDAIFFLNFCSIWPSKYFVSSATDETLKYVGDTHVSVLNLVFMKSYFQIYKCLNDKKRLFYFCRVFVSYFLQYFCSFRAFYLKSKNDQSQELSIISIRKKDIANVY